eukprot:scaffold2910_cov390-Prasinococcus_capsulatus_cf.AAC.7
MPSCVEVNSPLAATCRILRTRHAACAWGVSTRGRPRGDAVNTPSRPILPDDERATTLNGTVAAKLGSTTTCKVMPGGS